jgi:hypothetical protein
MNFTYIMPMLKVFHELIKFVQNHNAFVYDLWELWRCVVQICTDFIVIQRKVALICNSNFFSILWITQMMHYNNRGLFCDPNIIANNKERSFQNPAVANHNSSQTLKLLRYHNIRTRTIASPSQLQNLIQSQNFPIVTASIHCLRLTLHHKLFATHPSPQRLSESTQKSIGFRYKI